MSQHCLLRSVRPVHLIGLAPTPETPEPVDLRIDDGVIAAIGPSGSLSAGGADRIVDGGGRWALPGLWDQHVHLDQWALTTQRLDLSGSTSAEDACRRVADHLATLPPSAPATVQAFGHRTATWSAQPTVAELDRVTGDRPVVLISGDAHHGWVNSAALRALGLAPRDGVVEEAEWFASYARLSELPGARDITDRSIGTVLDDAGRRGIVGLVDLEFAPNHRTWPERFVAGNSSGLRIRAGVYASDLEDVIASGLRTGDILDGTDQLVTMGPLKIISDGSLNTRTAYCCEPYADGAGLAHPYGTQNSPPEELRTLLARARSHGLDVALHAIGDAAVHDALDAFAATGARGSIEHAQLITDADIDRMAALGIAASVQPAHLLDDREAIGQCWPDRAHRCFRTATMINSGVRVRFGSDAPVSPLDPWLTLAAAVHRGQPDQVPWMPNEAINLRQALACSTDGITELTVGGPGDVILLDRDPLTVTGTSGKVAQQLRSLSVAVTVVAGRVVHHTD